jgi:hypothetical protein
MAPLPPVSHVLMCRTLFTIGGKEGQGTRQFFRWTGTTPTPTVLTGLADDIFTAHLLGSLPAASATTLTYTGIELTDLTSSMGAQATFSGSAAGERSGDELPADVAFVTSFGITRRYRGGHPRAYWPFGVASDLTGPQQWTDGAVATFLTAVETYSAGIVGLSTGGTTIGHHVAVSFYEGFTAVEDPITHRYRNVPTKRTPALVTTVSDIVGRTYVGSFRRRRLKTS